MYVVVPVDDGYVYRRVAQGADRLIPANPAPMMATFGRLLATAASLHVAARAASTQLKIACAKNHKVSCPAIPWTRNQCAPDAEIRCALYVGNCAGPSAADAFPRSLPGLKAGYLLAGISIRSVVPGFTPLRAWRSRTSNAYRSRSAAPRIRLDMISLRAASTTSLTSPARQCLPPCRQGQPWKQCALLALPPKE